MNQVRDDIAKGFLGFAAAGTGTTISFLGQVEIWLRVASLAGGLIICILTIASIIKKWNK